MKVLKHFLVGAVIFVAAPLVLETSAKAQDWFKCAPGYNLTKHSRQDKVACRKYVGDKTTNIKCPAVNFMGRRIGTRPQVKSGKDKCRGTVTIGGISNHTEVEPLSCGPQGAGTAYRYTQNHHGNADKCVMFRLDGFFLRNGWVYSNRLIQTR